MKFEFKAFYRALALSMSAAIVIGSMVWVQASANPAAAQEPAELALQIILTEDGVSIAAVTPCTSF